VLFHLLWYLTVLHSTNMCTSLQLWIFLSLSDGQATCGSKLHKSRLMCHRGCVEGNKKCWIPRLKMNTSNKSLLACTFWILWICHLSLSFFFLLLSTICSWPPNLIIYISSIFFLKKIHLKQNPVQGANNSTQTIMVVFFLRLFDNCLSSKHANQGFKDHTSHSPRTSRLNNRRRNIDWWHTLSCRSLNSLITN
jgi:hypothetical protein